MKSKIKAGDIVTCNTTIFNLVKGDKHEVNYIGYFGAVFLKGIDNLDGGYGECWFETESQLFAESLLADMTGDIIAFEEFEKENKNK